MTTGCKVVSWFLLIGSGISVLMSFYTFSIPGYGGLGVLSLVIAGLLMAGIILILFKNNKNGYYAICAGLAVELIEVLIFHVSFVAYLIRFLFVGVLYTYLLYKNDLLPENLPFMPLLDKYISKPIVINRSSSSTNYNSSASGNTDTESVNMDNSDNASDNTGSETVHVNRLGGANNAKASTSHASQTASTRASATSSNSEAIETDLYKELGLERSWDIETIRKKLRELQKIYVRRQSACNDTEQLVIIDKLLNCIRDAFRNLTNEAKKIIYDKKLDEAYKNGALKDIVEEKLKSLLEQAREYYNKGNIQLATKLAKEVCDGNVGDPKAYEFLAACYREREEYDNVISTIDKAISMFPDNTYMIWLGARYMTDLFNNFEEAQKRINHILEIAPESSLGFAEQIYVHLRKEEEKLAFDEIDDYIAKHPNDNEFKKNVAYDLIRYSNNCYYHEAATDSYFIADKPSYDKFVKLRSKANSIYADSHTEMALESALYYGNKEKVDWNDSSIKGIGGTAIVFFIMGMISRGGLFMYIALILFAFCAFLFVMSFRPYWQINQTYVTGKLGKLEGFAKESAPIVDKGAFWLLEFFKRLIYLVVKLVAYIVSGGFFR